MKFLLALAATFILSAGTAQAATNISCTDSIKSLNQTATMSFDAACPANCTRGSVWGSDIYTTDSAICVAAVHSGVISTNGGNVKVALKPGQPSYAGTFANGVTTQNWGGYDQSFVFVKPSTGMMNISCGDSVKSLNQTASMDFSVVCPANCTAGSIWGTNTYTTDSSICAAAVHSGVTKVSGGPVRVFLKPGQASYLGSARNGVSTQNWGSYDQSFIVTK